MNGDFLKVNVSLRAWLDTLEKNPLDFDLEIIFQQPTLFPILISLRIQYLL